MTTLLLAIPQGLAVMVKAPVALVPLRGSVKVSVD